jgi:hypothetical protein
MLGACLQRLFSAEKENSKRGAFDDMNEEIESYAFF